ncbi:MAG: hypothetical protein JHD31_02980 [Rhodoluna sp.]|nr:hypothetical protein [Rhodoluna sp.]
MTNQPKKGFDDIQDLNIESRKAKACLVAKEASDAPKSLNEKLEATKPEAK